jgi:hypothetical protein
MLGGNPSIEALRLETLYSERSATIFPPTARPHSQMSMATTAVLLFKAACATDAFTLAASFEAGVFVSLIACLFMLLLTQGSFHVFTATWTFGHSYAYDEVWSSCLSPALSCVPKICLVLAYLSCVLYGYSEITQYVPDVLLSIWPSAPELLLSRWFLQYIFVAPLCLPSLLVRRYGSFGLIAWLSLFAYVTALFCLVVQIFRTQWDGKYLAASRVVFWNANIAADYQILSDFNTAFFAHSFVALVAQEMERPTRPRTLAMTWASFAVTAVLTYFVPLAGYLLFLDGDDVDCVFYALNPDDTEVIVGKIAVLIVSLCSTMVFLYHIAGIMGSFILPGVKPSGHTRFCSSIVLSLIAISINTMGNTASEVVYEIGGICFSVLGFVLPAVYFLCQYGLSCQSYAILSVAILAFGIVMACSSVFFFIRGLGLEEE